MISLRPVFDSRRLLLLLGLLLSAGFFATALGSYQVSKQTIRDAIVRAELPLASRNIYSEIQRDLVRPILISSTMAHDTFLRDWVLRGEQNVDEMARYLKEIRARYGAFSSFFVSERSGTYYHGDGVLKTISPDEPRDAWYYRVRAMSAPYEINVDPDLANGDALTIFINYRVYDFDGAYLGATGVGLTVDAVRRLLAEYQDRFDRTIYFVDRGGRIVLFGNRVGGPGADLRAAEGLGALLDDILATPQGAYSYESAGGTRLLNVTLLPELDWYLFVEKSEDDALDAVRQTLYLNLAICLVVTVLVVGLSHVVLRRYQRRIESLASFDKLTGLLNRQAFDVLLSKLMPEIRRRGVPATLILADLDHFKQINDRYGHQVGDRVLQGVARVLRERLRESDLAVRWGGEEFLLLLKDCPPDEAVALANGLREAVAAVVVDAGGVSVSVTMSLGVTSLAGSESVDLAVPRADAALYRAKAVGRDQVVYAPGPTATSPTPASADRAA